VLVTSASLTIPNHARYTAACLVGCVAVTGVTQSTRLLIGQRRANNYARWGGWISYVIVPSCAYGLLLARALLVPVHANRGLCLVAAGIASLLVLAIRKTWVLTIDQDMGPEE